MIVSEESYASDPSVFSGKVLSQFTPVTEEQLRNVISRSKLTSACVDPIQMKIVMVCLGILIPVIFRLINTSLLKGTIQKPLKCAVVKSVMKKEDWTPCGKELPTSVKVALHILAFGTWGCRLADGSL